jgi:hypothetical protein
VPGLVYIEPMEASWLPPGQPLAPEDIDRGFEQGTLFQRSAYRLELLDWYTSPATERRVARFLAGEKVTAAERASWLATVRNAMAAGATMSRVHVVAEPLSDYLRYELNCYESSFAAGEDIRILPAKQVVGLDLPSFDYWLFDDERAAVQHYGEHGAWLGASLVTDQAFVQSCQRWRDTALSNSTPLDAYTADRSMA